MKLTIMSLSVCITLTTSISAQDKISDPTRPSFGSAPIIQEKTITRKDYTLSAIFFKQGKRSAIINENLYQEGDTFSENRIVSINDTSVLLKNSDGYRRLKLINKFKKLKK